MRAAANPAPRARRPAAHRLGIFAACAAAALAASGSPVLAQSFTLVGYPDPGGNSQVYGLSSDGRTAAGIELANVTGFLVWTADAGRQDFGPLNAVASGISGDGRLVVGSLTGTNQRAMKWTQAGGVQNLGTLPGYTQSGALDANFDGSIVVGTCRTVPGGTPQGFRWTQSGGMVGLGAGTSVIEISGDGSTIVGTTGPAGNRPFRWTSGTGLQFLVTLDGSAGGSTTGVNNDGSIIVGTSGNELRGTMWINGIPMDLTGGSQTQNMTPGSVSDDGSVVAGSLNFGTGALPPAVWTPSTGMMRLDDYLAANGVTVPAGVVLEACTAISADGRTFAGYTSGSLGIQGFVAIIAPPCAADLDDGSNTGTKDHAVTIDDLLYFLSAFESGASAADLDNGSGTGTPDGAVTIDDLLFFLAHFEAGC